MPKGVKEFSEEWRKNISLAKKGKSYIELYGTERAKEMKMEKSRFHKGRTRPKETGERISKALKGRKLSQEWINKIIATRKEKGSYKMKDSVKENLMKIHTGSKHSKETKAKIGKANSIALKGKKQSKETIEKRSNALIGRIVSEETRRKISITNKGKPKSPGSFTKESRAKIVVPKKDTSIELKIQKFLRELHIEFYTHQYISEIRNAYQCDILIPSMKMIIECDGCFWHCCPICEMKPYEWTLKRRGLDKQRTQQLIEKGFKVLRLWEHEIKIMDAEKLNKRLVEIT